MAEQVKDWTADYDIFSPEYIKNPFPIWDEMRPKCPVSHTERWGGSWMPTTYEDLFNIARDVQHFSSRDVLVAPTGPPPPPPGMPAWQRRAAAAAHAGLYLLTLAIPVSGWLMSSASGFQVVYLGLLPLPDLVGKDKVLFEQLKDTHYYLNILMFAVVVLHVGAALKHHFTDRDDVLARMLPTVKPRSKPS